MNHNGIVVCIERGMVLKEDEVKQTFSNGRYAGIKLVVIFATKTGKYMKLLDSIF